MNTMMSLLSLQLGTIQDPPAIAALNDARNRLQSMGVLYEKLYCSDNYRGLMISDYLPPLLNEIADQFPNRDTVTIETELEDFLLSAQALPPIGLIVNELITNAMKYAFIGRNKGIIKVSASLSDSHATLIFEDNGNGIPESIDIENSTWFGLNLVGMMAQQLTGTIRLERGNGSKFILEFQV